MLVVIAEMLRLCVFAVMMLEEDFDRGKAKNR